MRLLQFNMCGHVCRTASRDKVAGVVDSLARFHPAAVSLNEVCRSQLTAITSGAAERGWAMHAEFLITQPDECTGGDDYGNAVLTRSPVADTDRLTYGAQDPGNPEHRGLLCVATDLDDRPTRICTTHIVDSSDDPVGDVRATQIAMAARVAGSYPGPVVLMGDFNARPAADAMSVLYSKRHVGGHGEFDEVDQGSATCRCGAATVGSRAKYDYIFVRPRDFHIIGADVEPEEFSDHTALLGRVERR